MSIFKCRVIAKVNKIIGKRPGEKLHEELISANESSNTMTLVNTMQFYRYKFQEL